MDYSIDPDSPQGKAALRKATERRMKFLMLITVPFVGVILGMLLWTNNVENARQENARADFDLIRLAVENYCRSHDSPLASPTAPDNTTGAGVNQPAATLSSFVLPEELKNNMGSYELIVTGDNAYTVRNAEARLQLVVTDAELGTGSVTEFQQPR